MERPLAVGHEFEEQLARAAGRLGDAGVEGGEHGGGAVAGEQLAQAQLGQVAGGHHGPGVALDHLGQARVAQEDPVGLLVELPLADDPDGGHEHALVIDLGGVRGDAARAQAADVLVVPEGRGEGHELAVVEHGHHEDHVLMVLHGAVGEVGVVEPVDVARPHGLPRIGPEDGLEHAGTARRDVAGHDAAGDVVDAHEVVLLLLDEGRHRAALHQELHLLDGRGEAAPDDLEGHGVDAGDRGGLDGHERSKIMFWAWSMRARMPGATNVVASA